MPKVSVVIPCYNVAPYVATCLDSLINQTLTDIEIICVDDKSTDDTAKIVTDYVKRDKRIKLIKQRKNQGVSVARNTGINAAGGEYIGFVDPDDYVDLDFYEKLYNAATSVDACIAKGGMISVQTDGQTDKSDLSKRVEKDKRNFNYQFSTAIYRREFLNKNNLRFLDGVSIGEDVNFLIKAVHLANRVAVVHDTYYWYIRRDDSAYSPKLNHSKIVSVAHASRDLYEWLKKQEHISKSDYLIISRPVFSLINYNIKRTEIQADQEILAQQILDIYKDIKFKRGVVKNCFRWYETSGIRNNNVDEVITCMQFVQRTYKLFGILPLFKTLNAYGREFRVVLLRRINLFRIKQDGHRATLSVLGVPVLKIIKR